MPVAIPACFRKTGGIRWHARALINWRLHAAFRRQIADFLHDWHTNGTCLVLVGPSAGWFLPTAFLMRFKQLICIDLDTSAPYLFRLRHGRRLRSAGIALEWIPGDFVNCLPTVLGRLHDPAVLFCNVLGQLALERADSTIQIGRLPELLARHYWASFHDSFSTTQQRVQPPDVSMFQSRQEMDAALLQRIGSVGEWVDHGTSGLLPASSMRRYIPWQITPHRFHWVEAGSVVPGQVFS